MTIEEEPGLVCLCLPDCSKLNGDCYSKCLADPHAVELNCSCLPGYHINYRSASCVGQTSVTISTTMITVALCCRKLRGKVYRC